MPTRTSLYSEGGRENDGPATRQLTDRQREFVLRYVDGGVTATAAARAAGFTSPRTHSFWLLRDPKVSASIIEETDKLLAKSAALGARKLILIAETDGHKDQLKASNQLLAHAGLAPVIEQTIRVEKTDLSAEAIRDRIRLLMGQIPEARRLAESAGYVVDAEFSVVEVDRPAD